MRELAGLDRGGRSEKRIAAREAGAGKALDMALSSCPSLLHDVLCCFFSGASDDPSRYRSVNREFVVAMTARGQVDAEQRPDGDRAIAREVLEALRPLYAADEFALYVAAVQAVVPDWFKDRNSPTRHAPTRPSPTGASAESAPAARAVSPRASARRREACRRSPRLAADLRTIAGPAHSEEPPAHPEEPAAPVVRQRLDRLAQDLKRVAVDARTAADGMQAGVPPPRPLAAALQSLPALRVAAFRDRRVVGRDEWAARTCSSSSGA
jgi:hypothetical protein